MTRFADCLAGQLSGSEEPAEEAAPAEAAPAEQAPKEETAGVPSASSGVSTAEAEKEVPSASSGESTAAPKPAPAASENVLDLGEASREAVLKRAIPVVAVAAALLVLLRILRR
jgi:hypothetical protein